MKLLYILESKVIKAIQDLKQNKTLGLGWIYQPNSVN